MTREARAAANDAERGEMSTGWPVYERISKVASTELEAERKEIQTSKLDHIAGTHCPSLNASYARDGSELAKVRDEFVRRTGSAPSWHQAGRRTPSVAGRRNVAVRAFVRRLLRQLSKSLGGSE